MARFNPKTIASGAGGAFTRRPSDRRNRARRHSITAAELVLALAFLLCLGSTNAWPQQDGQQQTEQQRPQEQQEQSDLRQMRGLDEQVQEVKSDVLSISAELSLLEEKLLYPSGTQVAVFVALAKGDLMRLDAVRLRIDDKLVAHYIYSAKELEALRKGGVQRLYVGNVSTGDHEIEVLVDGHSENGGDFSHTEHFTFRKEVDPKLVGLTLAGPNSGITPITLGKW